MLPDYDPEIKQCPKCGNPILKLKWRPPKEDTTSQDTRSLGEWNAPDEEHFRRDCTLCGFYWYEQPTLEPFTPLEDS